MKKVSTQDERVVFQKRKIGSDAFGIIYFGLIVSILLQQFMFDAPFTQYAAEFILFMVAVSHVDQENKYVFAVITYAHSPAGAYLDFKDDVDAWFKVKMPECDIHNASAPIPAKEKILLDQSLSKIDQFAKDMYIRTTKIFIIDLNLLIQ